jgi:outer membrane immunogenic protein
MKRVLLASVAVATVFAGTAMAADMRVKAPAPPPPPPAFSWSGFYIGGNIGGAWSNVEIINATTGASFNTSGTSGFMGGGQVGFNFQASSFVFGVEFDGDWTDLKRTSGVLAVGAAALQAEARTNGVTSLAARFGFAADRFFLYGKAGVGWVSNELIVRDLITGASVSATNSNSGFLWGIGGEYAFTPNWTVKLEYDHINLDDRRVIAPVVGNQIIGKRDIDLFKFGFNYKFDWAGRY